LDPVLLEVGIDPQNSPWPLKGSGGKGKPIGLYRIIGFAFRNQRRNIPSSCYAGKREPLCLNLKRGFWGLTPIGVERSLELAGSPFSSFFEAEVEIEEESPPELSDLSVLNEEEDEEEDHRDDLNWVALELTRLGEMKMEEGYLEEALRRELGVEEDHPIFIPAMTYRRNGRVVTLQLMEGYVFVAVGLPEVSYFNLERASLVNQVMSSWGSHGMRSLSVISNSNVRQMRRQLRELTVSDLSTGDLVLVVEGMYKNMKMEVLEVDEEFAILEHTDLRSLKIITRQPLAFLTGCSADFTGECLQE
jgi:transcription antitermination factor NusG